MLIMNNDYELIYFYQLCYQHNFVVKTIYKKYRSLLCFSSLKVFNKFFYLPFRVEMLFTLHANVIIYSLKTFSQTFKKSFKNYLIQNNYYMNLNFINKYSQFNFMQARNEQNSDITVSDELLTKIFSDSEKFDQIRIIKNNLHKLTNLEAKIIKQKLIGKSISEIMVSENYSYKQIDNATQRSIRKLKKNTLHSKFKEYNT